MTSKNNSHAQGKVEGALKKKVQDFFSKITNNPEGFYKANTELGQAWIRIKIAVSLMVSFVVIDSLTHKGHFLHLTFHAFTIFVTMTLIGVGMLVHIKKKPDVGPRKIFTIFYDSFCTVLGIYVSPVYSPIFCVVFLWIAIGNGMRYGRNALYFSVIASLFCLTTALIMKPEIFLGNSIFWISVYIAILLIPSYVAILTQKLAELIRSEREASRFKSNFLANMSHELRTPINGIINANALIRNSEDTANLSYYSGLIDTSSKNLIFLIEQLLDLNKIEAAGETPTPHLDSTNLLDLLIEISDTSRTNILHEDLYFKEIYDANLPVHIETDQTKLKQILLNLLGNAAKFTSTGGICLHSYLETMNDKSSIVFDIIDTGPGIKDGNEKKIFQAFFQEKDESKEYYEGAGIGLALSNIYAELLGGSIEYLRSDNKTTFRCKIEFKSPQLQDNHPGDLKQNASLVFLETLNEKESEKLWTHYERVNNAGFYPLKQKLFEPNQFFGSLKLSQRRYPVFYYNDKSHKHHLSKACNQITNEYAHKTVAIQGKKSSLDEIVRSAHDLFYDRVIIVSDEFINASIHAYRSLQSMANYHYQIGREAQEARDAIQSKGLYSGHVLLIDDNDINLNTMSAIMRHQGLTVTTANSGKKAIELLFNQINPLNSEINIILCDLQMPTMTGQEFISHYQSTTPKHKQKPIVIISADVRDNVVNDPVLANTADFIKKPIKPHTLMTALIKNSYAIATSAITEAINELQHQPGLDFGAQNVISDQMINDFHGSNIDTESIIELLEELRDKMSLFIPEIEALDPIKDSHEIRFKSHKAKGSLSSLGADESVKMCYAMQDRLKHNNSPDPWDLEVLRLKLSIDEYINNSIHKLSDIKEYITAV